VGSVVADDGLEGNRDPEAVEPRGQVKRVGVLAVRREQLRTNGDNLG
jgi:hypothetical protein